MTNQSLNDELREVIIAHDLEMRTGSVNSSATVAQINQIYKARIPKPKEIDGQPDAWDDIRGEYHTQESIQKQFYWAGWKAAIKAMEEALGEYTL